MQLLKLDIKESYTEREEPTKFSFHGWAMLHAPWPTVGFARAECGEAEHTVYSSFRHVHLFDDCLLTMSTPFMGDNDDRDNGANYVQICMMAILPHRQKS